MKITFVVVLAMLVAYAAASSHSEAPNTASQPQSDITDFYMFRSYETGRQAYVTLIMNVLPLQHPFAGPNYFALSSSHFYEIYVDNNGDAVEDLTFQFVFGAELAGPTQTLPIPKDDFDCFPGDLDSVSTHTGFALNISGTLVDIALKAFSPVALDGTGLNFIETYTLALLKGPRESPTSTIPLTHTGAGPADVFTKPFDYAGTKTFDPILNPYLAYANQYIYTLTSGIFGGGCVEPAGGAGQVFVGQRSESFVINLGGIFDLINFIPIPGFPGGIVDDKVNNVLSDKSITSLCLEIPISCLLEGGDNSSVIGGWSATRQLLHFNITHVPGSQVSRMGSPLVNELFIGLRDKAKFNKGAPKDDVANQFGIYVTHPTFPEIVSRLFAGAVGLPSIAPDVPRNDLVAAFLTGIPGLNQPTVPGTPPAEMLRLNTLTTPTARALQSPFGVIAVPDGDFAGFPNGRRPGDDVIDIALRVSLGVLCADPFTFTCGTQGPNNPPPVATVQLLDGAPISALDFGTSFPYLNVPLAGSAFGDGPMGMTIK